jgi:hypothetical protein
MAQLIENQAITGKKLHLSVDQFNPARFFAMVWPNKPPIV